MAVDICHGYIRTHDLSTSKSVRRISPTEHIRAVDIAIIQIKSMDIQYADNYGQIHGIHYLEVIRTQDHVYFTLCDSQVFRTHGIQAL